MSEHDIEKMVADHAALKNENTILKEQLALTQEQLKWLQKTGVRKKNRTNSCHHGRQYTAFIAF